jgi:hypothetical protein
LLGYGVGFRIAGYAGLDAGLDWTRAQVTTLYERSGDMRIQFHVRYAF